MKVVTPDYKNFFYPPGGFLLWIIIMLELFTFGIALVAMASYSTSEAEVFHTSRLQLNTTFGTINTIVLLSSGFLMAQSVQFFKSQEYDQSNRYLKFTMLLGLLFLVIKSIEYYLKIDAGLGMGYNTFFAFYWLLTLFHVIHVIVGLIILWFIKKEIKQKKAAGSLEDLEAGAAFWHMCDLIWLMLFPFIYLIF